MENWRTKPRIGRSEIVPFTAEIQSRLQSGQTIKKIFDDLTNLQHISIGYRQFVRHVQTLNLPASPNVQVQQDPTSEIKTPGPAEVANVKVPNDTAPKQRAPLSREDFAKIRTAPIDLKALSRPVKKPV